MLKKVNLPIVSHATQKGGAPLDVGYRALTG
jgi:hypothetical protein